MAGESAPVDRRWVAWVNPFSYLIDLVRLPLLGTSPDLHLWLVCIGMAIGGWGLAVAVWESPKPYRFLDLNIMEML